MSEDTADEPEPKPFQRTIRVRALLLADEKEWVLYGANDLTDQQNYRRMEGDLWIIESIHEAAVVVEFDLDIQSRTLVPVNPTVTAKAIEPS